MAGVFFTSPPSPLSKRRGGTTAPKIGNRVLLNTLNPEIIPSLMLLSMSAAGEERGRAILYNRGSIIIPASKAVGHGLFH